MATKTVGITADKASVVSGPQSGGGGIIVTHGASGNSAVEVHDAAGAVKATYPDYASDLAAFVANGVPTFGETQPDMSAEISWNPSNSGTLICTASSYDNAMNGLGSVSLDMSGDLRVGVQQSGSTFTAYETFLEFDCTSQPIATGAPNGAGGFGQGTVAASPCRVQTISSNTTPSGFVSLATNGWANNYGALSTNSWVMMDASRTPVGEPDASTSQAIIVNAMNFPTFARSLSEWDLAVPAFFAPFSNVARYTLGPSLISASYLATISRSAGLKIKFCINRYTYQEVVPWPGGGFIVKALI